MSRSYGSSWRGLWYEDNLMRKCWISIGSASKLCLLWWNEQIWQLRFDTFVPKLWRSRVKIFLHVIVTCEVGVGTMCAWIIDFERDGLRCRGVNAVGCLWGLVVRGKYVGLKMGEEDVTRKWWISVWSASEWYLLWWHEQIWELRLIHSCRNCEEFGGWTNFLE